MNSWFMMKVRDEPPPEMSLLCWDVFFADAAAISVKDKDRKALMKKRSGY